MKIQERYQRAVDEFVRRALEKYKDRIDEIILFGSVARGEAREDSDVDILVIWRGDEADGWRSMTGLSFDVLLEFVKEGFVEDVYGHALTHHAKDRREVADYDIGNEISKTEAEAIIEDAEKFLVRIKDAIMDILEERVK